MVVQLSDCSLNQNLSRATSHYLKEPSSHDPHALKIKRPLPEGDARLPLGVSSNFRYWGDDKTVYVKRGRGARVWDLDDNVYVDYRLGYGPVILGHCHPEVDAAAREGQQVGTVFALGTEREVAVAELIHDLMPGAGLSASPTPAPRP